MPSEVKTTYYENGQKRMEGNYKDGEYNGKWNLRTFATKPLNLVIK